MYYKQWLKLFLLFSFLSISFIVAIKYILDPLKLFHKPYFFKNKLNPNMRFQAAGIIKNYKFNSIILGTSMLENTSSREASNVLNSDFTNISIAGSDFYERSFLLNYALQNKDIQSVIYSLDDEGLIDSRLGDKHFTIDSFNYLYDNSFLNDFKYYLNLTSFKEIIKSTISENANFDTPNEWFSKKIYYSRFGGINNWLKASYDHQIKGSFNLVNDAINGIKNEKTIIDENLKAKIKRSEQYLNKYIITFVKNNPNTEFNLIIPPYSRIRNAINAQYNKHEFIRIKHSIKFLVKNSEKYSNLNIYGWGDKDFPSNISLYRDLLHYHPKINSKMLYWIKEKNGLLTVNNIDKYLNTFEKKALDYDLFELGKKIDTYISKN